MSSEIISTSRITVQPEKSYELCLTISSLLGRIRQEPGCRNYWFYGDEKDSNSFILIGEWVTQDAWDKHLKSENFAILLGSLKLLSKKANVEFQLLSHSAPIEEATRTRCIAQAS